MTHVRQRLGLFVVGFAVMEPVAALEHRFLMHGPGWGWHRGHHRVPGRRGLEPNDRFPAIFASAAIASFAIGTSRPRYWRLVPVAAGITAYGLSYLAVHEGFIHGRLPVEVPGGRLLDQLAAAHAVHHRTAGPPFGMLVPMLPRYRLAVGSVECDRTAGPEPMLRRRA